MVKCGKKKVIASEYSNQVKFGGGKLKNIRSASRPQNIAGGMVGAPKKSYYRPGDWF